MRCILVIPVLLLIVVACDPANFEEENGKEASLSGPPSWCENQRLSQRSEPLAALRLRVKHL